MPAAPAEFCRIAIGDTEVTFVPDGYLCGWPTRSYPGSDEAFWDANPEHRDREGLLVMSLGALLIRCAGKLALVDLGWGPNESVGGEPPPGRPRGRMKGGELLDNLRRIGVEPADIDVVLFSHLHGDHTGWLVDPTSVTGTDEPEGSPTFPNATNYLSKVEWEYWCEQTALGKPLTPSPLQLSILGSRLEFVEDGESVLPGVNVVETFGHTPGHLSFLISSGTDRALVLGDAAHCPLEILEPELTFSADVDPKMAQRTKEYIARLLLEPDTVAAAPHFADLVFGRLLRGEGRPQWHFPDSQKLAVAG